jgi:hypothetical protein
MDQTSFSETLVEFQQTALWYVIQDRGLYVSSPLKKIDRLMLFAGGEGYWVFIMRLKRKT